MKGLYGESILRGQVLVQLSEEVMKARDPKLVSAQGDKCPGKDEYWEIISTLPWN